MHIPDGVLDGRTLAATWVVAVPAVGAATRRARHVAADGRLVLMAVLAALIFALQMLNLPIAGGTSGHFTGGALAAIVLGPLPAMLVMTAVLVVQALIFGDGGVLALAANVIDLAIIAPWIGWLVHGLISRVAVGRGGRVAGAFIGSWAATVAGALGAAVLLWTSGAAPLPFLAGAMGAWHAVIGLGEGLVCAGIVSYIGAVRPDLLSGGGQPLTGRGIAASLGVAAALAVLSSAVASRYPDALERVLGAVGPRTHAAPGAGGIAAGVASDAIAGILAAVVGTVVAAALVLSIFRNIRVRRP